MEKEIKTTIYFSATGSCKKIADYFAEKLCITARNIANYRERQNIFVDGDCIFILPVYNGAIPAVCAEYINKLDGKNKKAFILCVYGGAYKGKALQNAAGLLKNTGFIPMRGAYIAAPHSYTKNKINLLEITRINLIYEKLFDTYSAKTLKLPATPKGWKKQATLKKITGKCTVSNACIGCGTCKNICPVNAINDGYKSNTKCLLCGACVKNCTQNARQINFYTTIPSAFFKLKCKHREDEFFNFY